MRTKIVPDLPHIFNEIESKPIPGYEGRYAAGADGSIWSLVGNTPAPLGQYAGHDGYLRVQLVDDAGKRKTHHVAHLIVAAWLGPRPTGYHVHHINCDKTDNRFFNVVYAEPGRHRRIHARMRARQRANGGAE